jgi:hypothetical protein
MEHTLKVTAHPGDDSYSNRARRAETSKAKKKWQARGNGISPQVPHRPPKATARTATTLIHSHEYTNMHTATTLTAVARILHQPKRGVGRGTSTSLCAEGGTPSPQSDARSTQPQARHTARHQHASGASSCAQCQHSRSGVGDTATTASVEDEGRHRHRRQQCTAPLTHQLTHRRARHSRHPSRHSAQRRGHTTICTYL